MYSHDLSRALEEKIRMGIELEEKGRTVCQKNAILAYELNRRDDLEYAKTKKKSWMQEMTDREYNVGNKYVPGVDDERFARHARIWESRLR